MSDTPHFPIYMDYAATTPVDPRVVDAMIPWLREHFGNPASRCHAWGWDAEEAVETARKVSRSESDSSGVAALRLSPQAKGFDRVCTGWDARLRGGLSAADLSAALRPDVPGGRLSDGFLKGPAGAAWSGAA